MLGFSLHHRAGCGLRSCQEMARGDVGALVEALGILLNLLEWFQLSC